MTEPRPLPPQDELKALFDYDPDTGILYWRERRPDQFSEGRNGPAFNCRVWNTRYAGKPAGTLNGVGYISVALNIAGRRVAAHRIIWKWVHGVDPDCVDHINHDRSDNRIANLRSVTRSENQRNLGKFKTNRSGVAGVQLRGDGYYEVSFLFKDLEEAAAFRRESAARLGYHPNHGATS